MDTFLVEHYRPGFGADDLDRLAARAARAVRRLEQDGRAVRFVRSLALPHDEVLFSVVEASSEQLVRDAYVLGGVPFERISPGKETYPE